MNTKGKTPIKENKMQDNSIYSHAFGRFVCHGGRAMLHRHWHVPSRERSFLRHHATWVNVHIFATALGFFGLFGMAGLYARQVEESGWLGLAGFLLFSAWMTLVGGFSFVEAFILPRLATESPAFVAGMMGMFSGIPSAVDLGVLPTLWIISGSHVYPWTPAVWHRYVPRPRPSSLGGCFAGPRNRVDPRRCTCSACMQPKIMIPVGLAMAWLGYALFSERRAQALEPLPVSARPQVLPTAAK